MSTDSSPINPNFHRNKVSRSVSVANKTLAFYQSLVGVDGEDLLKDLLCDLMHWSIVNPRSGKFGECLSIARQHYFLERSEAIKEQRIQDSIR